MWSNIEFAWSSFVRPSHRLPMSSFVVVRPSVVVVICLSVDVVLGPAVPSSVVAGVCPLYVRPVVRCPLSVLRRRPLFVRPAVRRGRRPLSVRPSVVVFRSRPSSSSSSVRPSRRPSGSSSVSSCVLSSSGHSMG